MLITKLNNPAIWVIEFEVGGDIFHDHRGQYWELWNQKLFEENFPQTPRFVQSDLSKSNYKVLRGIHGDNHTWKLVTCLSGMVYIAIVDCDKESASFGQCHEFTIGDTYKIQTMVLVHPKCGVAHQVLSPEGALWWYMQSSYYDRESQFTYRWDDPKFGINWPLKPILSVRDSEAPYTE